MSGDRRLSAPGQLAAGDDLAAAGTATTELPDEPLAEFAAKHGLRASAERPPAGRYIRSLWQRRHFIVAFATAKNIALYTEARLGQLWQVLTPLLNAAVYFLIFGVLLHISRGVPDYITFLVTGIFVFNFTQRVCITSSVVMRDNLPLIRALPFPRGCLPLGYVVIELQQLLLSFCVLFVIILAYGEPFTWYWFLILPVLALQTLFNVGCAFILARWGSGFDDVSQLLPFVIRTWMYASGVIFSITTSLALVPSQTLYFHKHLAYLLQINPAAVYITLIRNSLLTSQRISMPGYHAYNQARCTLYGLGPGHTKASEAIYAAKTIYYSSYCHPIVSQSSLWWYAIGWAVVAAIAGFFFFWRAETRYGRG